MVCTDDMRLMWFAWIELVGIRLMLFELFVAFGGREVDLANWCVMLIWLANAVVRIVDWIKWVQFAVCGGFDLLSVWWFVLAALDIWVTAG